MKKATKTTLFDNIVNGDIVKVTWFDIMVDIGWNTAIDVPKNMTCCTVGFFDRVEDGVVCVYSTCGADDIETNNRIFIPIGVIDKVRKLK